MTTDNRLQDDLIQEFRAEQQFVNEQLLRFDPLATDLRKPAAQRVLGAGLLLTLEILCYIAALTGIVIGIFHKRLYPLYLLTRFKREEYVNLIGAPNLANLRLLFFGMLALLVLLFWWLGRSLRRIRLKNALLASTGLLVKGLVGELLKRKASLDALEQRHIQILPGTRDVSSVSPARHPLPPPPGH